MKVEKPQLHGLSITRAKFCVISSVINAALAGFLFQQFYINKKKKIFKTFYENYDIDKEFEKMRKKGLFDSC